MGAYPAYKKDYEAMVFIDGWDVVAINSDGSVIDHGTNWVDDSDVIQSAIDYVVSATGGGKISIGAGVFVIYTPILVKSYIQLCGEGTTTTLYAETGLDDDVIYIEDQTNCLIENMWIAGNSAGQASGSGIYINHTASTDCFNVVKEVVITDCKEYGVEISSNSDYVSLLYNTISGCGTASVSDPTLTSVIRDTYGHTSIQSKRDYDAMVFIEGTSVIAVDSDGSVISRGVAGTDDATVIQAAITSVNSSETAPKTLCISSGRYYLSATVELSGTEYLTVSGGGKNETVLLPIGDTTAIKLVQAVRVSINNITCEGHSGMTEPLIELVGDNDSTISSSTSCSYCNLDMIRVRCSGNSHIGIKLTTRATEPSPSSQRTAIVWCNFRNIEISYPSTGIDFNLENAYTVAPPSDGGWINANTFENISINAPVIAIDFTNSLNGLMTAGNCFNNIQVQASATTTHGIKNIWRESNMFDNIYFWDWKYCPTAPKATIGTSLVQGIGLNNTVTCVNHNYNNPGVNFVGFGDIYNRESTGNSNSLILPHYVGGSPRGSTTNIRVSNYGGDYDSLQYALTKIYPSSDHRFVVHVYGKISETDLIVARSYVDVIGHGAYIDLDIDSNGAGISFDGVVDSTWQNLKIVRSGTVTSDSPTIEILGASTPVLDNIVVTNSVTGANGHGLYIYSITDGSAPRMTGCSFTGSSGSYGCYVKSVGPFKFDSCNMYAVDNGFAYRSSVPTGYELLEPTGAIVSNCNLYADTTTAAQETYANIEWRNCTFVGGDSAQYARAYYSYLSHSKFVGCTFISNSADVYSPAILLYGSCYFEGCDIIGSMVSGLGSNCISVYQGSSQFNNCSIYYYGSDGAVCTYGGGSVCLSNCQIKPRLVFKYHTGCSGDGTFTLVSGSPYYVDNIEIYVSKAGGVGSTVDFGTTIGGSDIASGVDTSSTGWKAIKSNYNEILADSPIYYTSTDPAAVFTAYVTLGYNNTGSVLDIRSTGKVILYGTGIVSNPARDRAMSINSVARSNDAVTLVGCNMVCLDPTKVAIKSDSIYRPNAYGCNIIGRLENVYGVGYLEQLNLHTDVVLEKLGTPRLLVPCIDTTGTTITDYTRNLNNLTAVSSVVDWFNLLHDKMIYYDFNGTAHYLYRANDTDFDFGNAATDDAFSIVCCVNPDDVTSRQIIGKWDDNNQREWRLFFDANGYPTLQLYDESADTYIGRQDQTAFTTGSWQVIVATYDGSGINAGCKIYIDGVQLDDADYDNGVYVAMEAVTANLMVGALKNAAAYSEYYDGKMTWIGVAAKELSADEVWSLTQRLKGVLGI